MAAAGSALSSRAGQPHMSLAPVPPRLPRPVAMPGKMARPEVYTLNSYAVRVDWIPPADFHARPARRGTAAGLGSRLRSQEIEPVAGYRLRYWVHRPGVDEPLNERLGALPEYTQVEETWPSSVTFAVLKWLVADMAYEFQVAAYNAAGQGPWSESSETFLMPPWPHSRQPQSRSLAFDEIQPGPVHLSPRPDCVEVRWPPPCHRGAPIMSYDVVCSKDPDFTQFTKQLKTSGESTAVVVGDLEPNTVYYFKHRAVNRRGPSVWSDPTPGIATAAKPPERPSAPTRASPSDGPVPARELTIRWDAPETYGVPVQHYRVRCSTSAGMEKAKEVPVGAGVATLGAMDALISPSSPSGRRPGFNKEHYALTQLKIRGLEPMTSFFFQVRAINQVGTSEWSLPSEPLQTGAERPGKPGQPRLIAGTKLFGLRICWAVPETHGSPIDRYDVRVSEHAMMLGSTEHRNVLTKPADCSGMRPRPKGELLETVVMSPDKRVDVFCQVRAVNAAGPGEWSDTSKALRVAAERPARPEAPHSVEALHRACVVRWEAPDCNDSPITGYRLRYGTTKEMQHAVEVQGLYGPVTEHAVTHLPPHGAYYFQVCAMNAVGCSDWSPPSWLIKVRQVPPAKISAPSFVRSTGSSITVSMVSPADCGTRDADLERSYTLFHAPGGTTEQPMVLAEAKKKGAGTIYYARAEGQEVKGLRPGSSYRFQAFASNQYGDGDPSEVAEFTTSPAAPEQPGKPWRAERTRDSIIVGITPGLDNGAKLTHLELEVAEDLEGGKSWPMPRILACTDDDGLQYYTVLWIRSGIPYRFRAQVANEVGDSPWSEWSEALYTESMQPEHVQRLRAENVIARSYRLHWDVPFHNGEEVTSYRVQWGQERSFGRAIQEVVVSDTWADLGSCKPGLPSFARVAAQNKRGWSAFSDPLCTVLGADVPDAPPHVHTAGVGPIAVRVGWLLPYDNGSPITHLWVRYTETGTDGRPLKQRDHGEVVVVGRKRFCRVEPLFSQREYTFEVAAQNGVGIGPWSQASAPSRVPQPGRPTAPGRPNFVEATLTSLVFEWDASDGMGASLLEQVVHACTDPKFPEGGYITMIVPPWSTTSPTRQVGHLILPPQGAAPQDELHDVRKPDLSSTLGSNMRLTWGNSTASTACPPSSSRPVTQGRADSRPSSRQPGQSPLPAERWGWAESCPLDGGSPEFVLGDGGTQDEESLFGYTWELQQKRRVSSCGIAALDLGDAVAAVIGSGEDAPQEIQLVEGFDDILDGFKAQGAAHDPPKMSGEYELPGLRPGTHYYIRVAGRNRMGLSPLGPRSARAATTAAVPRPIPEDPGILLLRPGATSLTLGWMRPDCRGMPVTHYTVRCSETEEGLDSGNCMEVDMDEMQRETWPGMVEPQPYLNPIAQPEKLNTEGKDVIVAFVTFLTQRFQSLQESWDWLDVNGNGEITWQEFTEGDEEESGSPFEDFAGGYEALAQVWKLVDADGGGAITVTEYSRLRPYFDSVRAGKTGNDFPGVYALVPGLKPGQKYYFAARAVNKRGGSDWIRCGLNPITSETLPPAKMQPVEGVTELQTRNSVTLRWELPYHGGEPITKVELRYLVLDIEEEVPNKADLRDGKLVEINRDPDGQLQTRLLIPGLLSGQLVVAVGRAHNTRGTARHWSNVPAATRALFQDDDDGPEVAPPPLMDLATMSSPPDPPSEPPNFKVESLVSREGESRGQICLITGRNNGEPFSAFDLQILDESGEVVREWRTYSGPEENAELRQNGGLVHREFMGLAPGVRYCLKARCLNVLGASPWSEQGPWATMPPDVPQEPASPLSDFTSLTWVELKFMSPHDNGAKIEKFGIRTAPAGKATDPDWRVLTDDEVREHLRLRETNREGAVVLCRVCDLNSGMSHLFCVRAANSVGWSSWSQPSRFVTKPARPGQVPKVVSTHTSARSIGLRWEEPEMGGLPAQRYEVLCGPNLSRIRWAQLVSTLLAGTPDTDRLFGELMPPELGVQSGTEGMSELVSEEMAFLPLEGDIMSCTIEGLLPAQEYYFVTRVVTAAGRGVFSAILGPLQTRPEQPCDPVLPEVVPLSEYECQVLVRLPYDNGLPITDIKLVLVRCTGPLAEDEVDITTGRCQDHLARRELALETRQLPRAELSGITASPSCALAGSTAALRRSYLHEGLDPEVLRWDGCSHSRHSATGRQLVILLQGLRPGTSYGVHWKCSNELGWSPYTLPEIKFETTPAQPDKPARLEMFGGI